MENQKKDEPDAAELVSSLMAVAPSAAFVLSRIVDESGKRQDFHCRIQLTRSEEDIQLLARAQEKAKKHGEIDAKYGDIYREAQLSEIAARVLRKDKLHQRPDGSSYYPQVFVDGQQLRESFTANEIALIINALEVTKARFSCVEQFSPDELDLWAGRLSDTILGPFYLERLDSKHWPALLTALALEVQALRAEVSRPLPNSRTISASEPTNSPTGTGGSSSLSTESLTDNAGTPIHSEHLLTRQEANEIVRRGRNKK